jgi:glycosyltransferase involved in cell wall biosynthesis
VIAIANVCDFGVYLSKSEGFGLPILDYFSLGLPVLAPNIPPFNQLHDKGVLFADITSADSLKIQLRNIMKNVELRNNLTKEVNEIELIDWASVTQTLMRKIKSSKGELTWSLDSRSIDFVKKENSFLKNQEFKASLTIAISTYNRYESLKLNLSWLMNLVEERDLHLVVIDNASTDETHSLKAQYEERGVKWITNPTNLGLLGNMRRVACEINTTHVWTIGDDDFITPEGLEITLELLNKFPNMPTIVHQIAVFHANLSLTNNQSDLKLVLKSAKSLSNHVESGFSKVIEVATYNETLFGALYQFVWRSDWVRGSFAHYEMGEFFSNNWNTIPSTHYLLEFCPQNLVYWSHVVGIKANGLNSWENHRPKWHSLITPKAIQMARINGMNQRFGDDLQKHHQELFVDSFKSKENREIKMSKAEILEALDMASRLESSNREFLLLLESELKKFSS